MLYSKMELAITNNNIKEEKQKVNEKNALTSDMFEQAEKKRCRL